MTKRSTIGVGVVLLLLLVGLVGGVRGPTPTTVRIRVTGPAGQNVEAMLEVDGESRKDVGVIPTEFVVEGGIVSFDVSGLTEETFKVEMEYGDLGYGGSSEGSGTIRGGFIGPKFFGLRRERKWWGRHPDEPVE